MRKSILALLLTTLAITVPGVAKSHNVNDYPLTVTVTYVNHNGSFKNNCNMTISGDNGWHAAISSNGICYTFAPGSVMHARRSSFLGVPMIEFLWDKNGKAKTSKYRIDSEW